ncbi:MAG TPA: hypothetical protein VEB19_11465 [Gemmatimonadaceae bacterium]|nr:hypothetical protein [Gemmatimonadaceae bacterium]
MRAFVLYVAGCVVIVALIGAIAWSFVGEGGRSAMLVSAGLAVVVQAVAFTLALVMRRRNVLVGWGLGSLLRLVVLVVYALVAAKTMRSALTPALLSFVGFLFVTTVIEPIFLKQ